MMQFIVKQPNGRWAIWSTAVNDYIVVDADAWKIMDSLLDDARQAIAVRMQTAKDAGGEVSWEICEGWKKKSEVPGNCKHMKCRRYVCNKPDQEPCPDGYGPESDCEFSGKY